MCKVPPVKEELSVVTQAIILSILIDSIMLNYNPQRREERVESINKVRQRVKKYLSKKAKTNRREFTQALKISQEVWGSTIDHFEKLNVSIEATLTVTSFYNLYDIILAKQVNLTERLIEKFSCTMSDFTTLEIERSTKEVTDMILDKLAVYTGVHRRELPAPLKEKIELWKKSK